MGSYGDSPLMSLYDDARMGSGGVGGVVDRNRSDPALRAMIGLVELSISPMKCLGALV